MTKSSPRSSNALTALARLAPAVVVVSTAIVLLAPAALLVRLGLREAVDGHRAAIGLTAVISAATLLVAQVFPWIFLAVRKEILRWWQQRRGKRRLHELTRSEKNLLKQYLTRETRTLVLDPSSSATSALLLDEIIYRAAELDDKALGLAFNIQPWVWSFLKDRRSLLETSEVSSARIRTTGSGAAAASGGSAANRPLG